MKKEIKYTIRDAGRIKSTIDQVVVMIHRGLAGGPVVLTLGREKRSLDQNAKMWAMLGDISEQVEWYGQHLKDSEWKDVLTASLKKQRAVPGIDGGFVVLGAHTSKMDKQDLSDLIELAYAFGAEKEVIWSEKVESYNYPEAEQ